MIYYKLKTSLNGYEERLNRTFLFRTDLDLDELAFAILSMFNTDAYHMYEFEDDSNKYECEISLSEAIEMGYPNCGKKTENVTLDKLKIKKDKFIMTYDFGENYEFVIEILGTIEIKGRNRIPIVIDGVGYGILEDNRSLLEAYLDGEIEFPNKINKRGRYVTIDFDYFSVNECNEKMKREISIIRQGYLFYNL